MKHDIAHIRREDEKEQTVKEHIDQVSYFCAAFGGKIAIPHLARLAGILHDMGKEKGEFSQYIQDSFDHPDNQSKRGQVDHATAGAKYLFEKYGSANSREKVTMELLAMVIAYHHGGLGDFVNPDAKAPFIERMRKEPREFAYEESVANYLKDCYSEEEIEELFQKAKHEVEQIVALIKRKKQGCIHIGLLAKYLFSCVIDADRLDTYLFNTNLTYEEKTKEEKARLWDKLVQSMERHLHTFTVDTEVNRVRSEVSERCLKFADCSTGIYSLTVPTGGGKTLSSLRFAINHAKKNGKERVIYIVPFLTIIDQNVKETKKALNLENEKEYLDIILEQHSNVVRDDENETFKLMTERWDAPIIFSSMVQFLETFYAGGTQKVRKLHQLAQAVIVFDEVQAVPTNCTNLFNVAVNFLANICESTILLCTATQPTLDETNRPILKNSKGELAGNVSQLFKALKRVKLVDASTPTGFTIAELGNFTFEKAMDEENSLVVLNTKTEVRNLYFELHEKNELLKEDERFTIFYLSTNLCAAHRMKRIEDLKKALKEKKRVICLSTQLIEAGIDISFHCVIRALAGMDSIAQAAGRCNRHGNDAIKNVYIVNIKDEKLGSLEEIKTGKEISIRVLEEYRLNPQNFDYDRLSPKMTEQYFRYFYSKQANRLDYPYDEYSAVSIMTLLNENQYSVDAYRKKTGQNPQSKLHQAFHTAAAHFQVIPDQTTGVIVPYQEGKQLIEKINGDCSLPERIGYLNEAQRYSVNLFDSEIKKINQGIYPLNGGVALALQAEFYDDILGVITEGKAMDSLFL